MRIASSEILVLGDAHGDPPGGRIDAISILRIRTTDGTLGLAEVFGVPPGAESVLGGLIAGSVVVDPRETRDRLYDGLLFSHRRGWSIACLGALDVALWDAFARERGVPVCRLLGSTARDPYQADHGDADAGPLAYATVYTHDRDAKALVAGHLARIETVVELGYRVLKLEPMQSSAATIERLVRETRALVGPAIEIGVDVGYRYTDWWEALRTIERISDCDIAFFETPLPVDLLAAYAELARRSPIALAAGEHASSRWDVELLIDHGVQVVQPYATAVGGLSEMSRVLMRAEASAIQVVPGNWSTALQTAANLHAVAGSRVTRMIESAPSAIYASPLRRELERLGPQIVDGRFVRSEQPGLGIELPSDVIESFAIR